MARIGKAFGALFASIRAHPIVFLAAVVAVLALNLVLPPLVLSIVRQPFDYFSFNPWLHNVPSWFVTADEPLGQKLQFVWGMALFWVLASGQFTPTWGFTVTTSDLARWMLMGVFFGAYFSLWVARRGQLLGYRSGGGRTAGAAAGGAAGALLSVLGFSTMPCSVAGCGAPILPVLGLALTGLSSGAISLISMVSQILFWIVLLGTLLGIAILSYRVSGEAPAAQAAGGSASRRHAAAG